MATVCMIGSTGMVGAHILSTLLKAPSNTISSVHAFSRRELLESSTSLESIVEEDSRKWPSLVPHPTALFISALGTTRAAAGGLENQRKIDYGLNLDMAKAAKAAGASTFLLISTSGANATSRFPYTKMKGELEDSVKELGFDHTIILQPGLIQGERQESRPAEWVVRKIAAAAGAVSGGILSDFWAQDATVIARAAISAGLQCLDGSKEKGVWIVGQGEIMQLGKRQWKNFT